MEDFFKAWHYLTSHNYYNNQYGQNGFVQSLDIEVVKVNPATDSIDDNDELNTEVQIWLESGDWDSDTASWTHDYRLDVGAETFEQAIIELAELLKNLEKEQE